jgi:hypothetical protein
LFSCYVCMFCGILCCFGLFWIVLDFGFTFNRKGRSVLKKGRDGRNSCTSCHSVTENCYPVLDSLNPHPKPQQKKKKSLRFCLCSSRVTYGYLFIVLSQRSVSINRFKVRICLASSHCCTNLYPLCIHVSLQSYHGILVGCLEILVQILEVGKLERLRHHHIFFFCIGLCFKGGRGVRA